MIAKNSKASVIGFFCGVILVIGATLLNVEMKRVYLESMSCIDCGVSFGLPYEIFETNGFGGIYKIFWLGLVADILIGLIFSIGLGCVFQAIEKFIFVANGD